MQTNLPQNDLSGLIRNTANNTPMASTGPMPPVNPVAVAATPIIPVVHPEPELTPVSTPVIEPIVTPPVVEVPATAAATTPTPDTIVEPIAQPISETPVTESIPVQVAQVEPIVGDTELVIPSIQSEIPETEEVAQPIPSAEPSMQPEPAPVTVEAPKIEEIQPIIAEKPQEMHTNTASLNVLSDIIPEPAPITQDAPVPTIQTVEAVPADLNTQNTTNTEQQVSTQNSVAPEGELSQVFQLTPSEVAIPEKSNVMQEEELVMVPVAPDLTMTSNQANGQQINQESGFPVQQTAVSNAVVPAKNSKAGTFVRFVLWGLILILGVVAVVLGAYFANVIELPFLDTIF